MIRRIILLIRLVSNRIQTSRVSSRDWLTVLMMHAASVYNPAGDIANFLAASWQRMQYFKHCRHAFSSNVIRRWFAGVHFVCVPFCWIVFRSSSNSVTPSIGSPTNSCTKLRRKNQTQHHKGTHRITYFFNE